MGNFKRGWAVICQSLMVFRKFPCFVTPILLVWIIYASTVLYLKYAYVWELHSVGENIAVVFLAIWVFSFSILLSCDIVLRLIRHAEEGAPFFIEAAAEAVGRDTLKLIPLATLWAIIWFVLSVIEAILAKARGRNDDTDTSDFNAQNVALTVANYRSFSLTAAFFDALKKGVRMVMFLILPAMAWEGLGFFQATKKGLVVLKAHLGDFASGYALTYAAGAIIFLPPAIIFELGVGRHGHPPLVNFPEWVWVGVTIYIGLAWSFCVYLEQMFMAQLYLWHLKWEKQVQEAQKSGKPLPAFTDVKMPVLLDEATDLFS